MSDDAIRAPSLFEQVVAESGLSTVFATAAVKRVCQRVGIEPSKLTRSDLRRLLPGIESALRVYLSDAEATQRIAAIGRLVG